MEPKQHLSLAKKLCAMPLKPFELPEYEPQNPKQDGGLAFGATCEIGTS